MSKKSLKERTKELGNSLPFMEGRVKGEQSSLVGEVVTIRDYGFMEEGAEKQYVAYIIDEEQGAFFFGGTVLTNQMMELDGDGYGEEIRKNGLPVLFTEEKSKNKRTYTNVKFYPED